MIPCYARGRMHADDIHAVQIKEVFMSVRTWWVLLITVQISLTGGCATRPTSSPAAVSPTSAASCATGKLVSGSPADNFSDIQCRTEVVTGSLLANRICTTKAQRDLLKALTDQQKEELRNFPTTMCKSGSPPPCTN
jgi:hypothetical protein